MRATSDHSDVLLSRVEPTTVAPLEGSAGSSSRYCVFNLVDNQFADLVHGGLGPTLVAFVRQEDASRARLQEVMERVGSDRLRCILVDPDVCPNAAARYGASGESRYLLFVNGQLADGFDLSTSSDVLARLVAEASDRRP
jgi:hypothetical protein